MGGGEGAIACSYGGQEGEEDRGGEQRRDGGREGWGERAGRRD